MIPFFSFSTITCSGVVVNRQLRLPGSAVCRKTKPGRFRGQMCSLIVLLTKEARKRITDVDQRKRVGRRGRTFGLDAGPGFGSFSRVDPPFSVRQQSRPFIPRGRNTSREGRANRAGQVRANEGSSLGKGPRPDDVRRSEGFLIRSCSRPCISARFVVY